MAKMKKDEATMLKSLMVELDDNTVLLVTQQYHTEPRESDGKPDREKSRYIWISRVMTKDEVNAWAKWCWADENRLGRWKWPGTENAWPFYLLVNKDGDCRAASSWLMTKLKKLMAWKDGIMQIYGWKKETKSHPIGEYQKKAMYVHEGYTADNGDIVDLTDREALLKHIGQNLVHAGVKDIAKYATEHPPKEIA